MGYRKNPFRHATSIDDVMSQSGVHLKIVNLFYFFAFFVVKFKVVSTVMSGPLFARFCIVDYVTGI